MLKVIIYSNFVKDFEKNEQWERMLQELPYPLQVRIKEYQSVEDQRMRILGKWQLQQLLRDFGMDAELSLTNLQYNAFNKPYFAAATRPFYFNTSHSGGLTVCAASPIAEIGIDVEAIATGLSALRLGSAHEPTTDSGALLRELKTWTAHEAAHKAAGVGAIEDLPFATIQERFSLLELNLDKNFVGHLALETKAAFDVDFRSLFASS